MPSSLSLTNTFSSAVHWIDIDGDGDLDISISGDDAGNTTGQGILYFLQDHVVIDNMLITPMEWGDMTWCDFNNDGVPDILYAGESVGNVAGIDVVSVATKTYSNLISSFIPVRYASVDWGDYDNDGDYDALIAGEDASNNRWAILYKNNNGTFEDIHANLPGIKYGRVRFVDYDLDQDLDIFITGQDINQNKYTRLWKNTNGTFTVTSDNFKNVYHSNLDWADFNGDGYPDLVLTGYDGSVASGLLYINNAGNGFTLSDLKVPPADYSGTGFGDVDNDGDLDLFVSGNKDSVEIKGNVVFTNDGTDTFNATTYTITNHTLSNFEFGDYDGDNDLDFIVNGRVGGTTGYTHVAENTCSVLNAKPSVPQNPSAEVSGTTVELSWDRSSDDHTPDKSITYNIYIGTTNKGIDIVSPHASTTSGLRTISRQGYIRDTAWTIKDLPTGTYYWGVQAIDNSLAASAFSDESSFEIKDRFSLEIYNEPEKHTIPAMYFDCDHDNDYDLFLTNSDYTIISPYTASGFSRSTYDTILQNSFYPTKTITPNDWDNNNLIDFSISGDYTVDGKLDSSLALFKYVTDFNYSITDSSVIKDTDFEYAIWTDLDNDGLQDLISSGMTTNLGVNDIPVTHIYRNKGDGSFEEMVHSIRGFVQCGATAADFNNDMATDIIIYGKDISGLPDTWLYINNGNFDFTEHLIPNNQLYRKELYYGIYSGDFDLNGQLDVYLAGVNMQNDYYARVLLNNNLNFSEANLPIRSWPSMSNYWTDYDYDGDLDIFSTSTIINPSTLFLYINNNQTLEEYEIDFGIHLLKLPFMAVNLDGMNGVDFIMRNSTEGNFYQYFDNWGSDNRITSAPQNLSYERSDLDVIFKWDKLPDCQSCSYNLRIGTHPDSVNVMSPMSDLTTGFRYVIKSGNTYLNNQWIIKDMSPDTYYWSVQAVDQANTGGPWAPLQTFTLTNINAEFTFDTVCLENNTHFYDQSASTDAVVAWKWFFGDGQTATVSDPTHTYDTAGTYSVILWAYSLSGDSSTMTHNIIVKHRPVADFSADIACLGTSTNFTNNTNPNGTTILTWLWNFGDGEVSTLEDPGTNGYINAGNYEVNLVATADNGCVDYITKTVTVSSYPVTLINADAPLTFCKGDSVTLSVPYNSNYNYNWMAGGTSLTGGDTSKYVARLTGNYNVEVINPVGDCRDTSSIVTITANVAPVAPLISADGDLEFCQGDSVVLSVTNTVGYIYQWKLNGGAVGTDSCRYVAKAAGTYSLTVSNSTGCSADATNTINVTVNPKPSIPTVNISGPTTFCQGSDVELSVTDNPSYTYQWENNEAAITGAVTNAYTVENSGVYSLKISNTQGCYIKTENVTINSLTAPSAPLITASGDLEFCHGDSVVLSVTNTAGYIYQWKLNGGAVGSDTSRLIAKNTGEYNLVVTNTNLCSVSSSNSVNVVVNPLPTAGTVNLSGSSTFCEGGSVTLSISSTTGYSYNWRNEYGPIPDATTTSYTASSQGIYQLDVTNSYGCIARTLPVNVTVKPMPYVPVITSDNYQAGECMGETPVRLYVDQEVPGYNYQWYRNGIPVAGETLPDYEDFLTEGDYSLEADLDGCTAESNIMNVYFEDAPDKPFIHVQGPTVWYLICSDTTGSNYRWYCNGNLIERANKYYYIAGRKMGDYQVSIGNSLGCYTMSDVVTIPTGDTGTDDVDPFEGLKIYPNPTTGLFTIAIDNNIFGELIIRVIAENGKEVMSFNLDKTTEYFLYEVDLSGQSQGLYIINLLIDRYFSTKKIIIE
jgi:PKD repeat protein